MKRDSRLSGMLHILLHLAEREEPATSEMLAKAMQTNPVVIRKVMGNLRKQKYVQSEKGHGGGWRLSCDLSSVTLLDIYTALGEPTLLAMGHRSDNPTCLVEKAVNTTLGATFKEAEELILSGLGKVTLAELRKCVQKGVTARRKQAGKAEPGDGTVACSRDGGSGRKCGTAK